MRGVREPRTPARASVASPELRGARVGDDLVLLDLRAGDYALAAGLFGPGTPQGGAAVEQLRALTDDRAGPDLQAAVRTGFAQAAPLIRSADRGLPAYPYPARPQDVRRFVRAWAGLGVGYLGRSFRRVIADGYGADPPSALEPDDELLRQAAVFAHLLPWAPWPGVCLYRAAFLRRYLAEGGRRAAWVFGVRTWPFRAHCWLQTGDCVLNDDPARTGLYTPILVV